MRPAAILFDLGGVLLPFDRERRVRAIVRSTGATAEAVRAFMAGDIHRRLDRGEANEHDLAAALSDLAGRDIEQDEACELILSVFEAPNAELWARARTLRDRLIVGGFSDNPAFVRRVSPRRRPRPDVLVERTWANQVHARGFRRRSGALDLPPDAILFVDDTLANIEQARRMGWDGVVFVSNDQLIGEFAARGIA